MLHHDSNRPIAAERWHSGVEFIEDDPQRIDVTALPGRSALNLFWSEIVGDGVAISVRQQGGRPKIGEQWRAGSADSGNVVFEQDIGGFDVAMDDTMLMSSIDGPCKSGKQLNGFGRRGRSPRSRGARYVVSQALSLDIFHGEADQRGRAVRIPRGQHTYVVNTHDVWVVQGSDAVYFMAISRQGIGGFYHGRLH